MYFHVEGFSLFTYSTTCVLHTLMTSLHFSPNKNVEYNQYARRTPYHTQVRQRQYW